MNLEDLEAKRQERNKRLGITEAEYLGLRDKMHELQWADAGSREAREIYELFHRGVGTAAQLLTKHGIR